MSAGHFSRTVRRPDPWADQSVRPVNASLFLQRDFSERALRQRPEPQFDLSAMAEARREGFEAGRLAGFAEANVSRSADQTRAIDAIAVAMADADTQVARFADGAAATLAAALIAAMRAMMPDLIRRSALGEVGAMLAHVLPGLTRQLQVDVEVPSAIADGVTAVMEALAPGGVGRITVRGSDVMEAGGASVSWSAGEARRRPTEVWRAVMDVIDPILEQPETEDAANG